MPLTESALLTPEIYDQEEEKGRAGLSNRVIEAFQPQIFNATGYPVHVRDIKELWRYVDVMHETRLKSTVEDLLQGLTPDEFGLFKRAVIFMAEFTTKTFGKPFRCENALMRAINIFRYIRAAKPRVVMELGPGSGYLGLLHILAGIQYIGVENTQAFYLLQNRMWAAASEGVGELAIGDSTLRDATSDLDKYPVLHVPWWKTVDLDLDAPPVSVDVVTANHCLAEMHGNAVKYYARLAYAGLKPNRGKFIFEGWGYELLRYRGHVAREFDIAGLRMCHVEDRVIGYASDPHISDFMNLPRKFTTLEKLRSLQRRLTGIEQIPHGYEVYSYTGHNSLSALIRDTQKTIHSAATVTFHDVTVFLTTIYGESRSGQEERFLELIEKNYA